MSSRKAEKDRLREARLARERGAEPARRRDQLMKALGVALIAVAVVATVIAVATSGCSSHSTSRGGGITAGLQDTAGPWPPEFNNLATRLQAMHLPSQSDSNYHVHAELRVYAQGRQMPVPAQIGIDPQGQFLAPPHTHDSSGIIHIDAARYFPFTPGQLFTIWSVRFTRLQLGRYVAAADNVLAALSTASRLPTPGLRDPSP